MPFDESLVARTRSEPHVAEFQIQGRGTMKGWFVVGLEDDKRLKEWIQGAIKFVDTLPSK